MKLTIIRLRVFEIFDVKTSLQVPREALIDIELPNGDIMPAGTNFTVDISVMAVKNDPWGSDALEFNPDRYKETELHPYQARITTDSCPVLIISDINYKS